MAAIRAECGVPFGLAVLIEQGDRLARLEVPDLRRRVVENKEDASPIRAEGDACDLRWKSHLFPVLGVPNLVGSRKCAGYEVAAIRAERNVVRVTRSLEGGYLAAGLNIPDLDRRPGGDCALAIEAEFRKADAARQSFEVGDFLSRVGVPNLCLLSGRHGHHAPSI